MSWRTIHQSQFESDLLVLKSKLESEGIRCNIKNVFGAQFIAPGPATLVDLQVHEDDLQNLRQLVEDGVISVPS